MLATWGCTTFPKPTLSLDFLGATSLDSGITFSRGSQATLFDSTGTLVYAKHNLLLQSEDFATTWIATSATVTTNTIVAPDGALTGDKYSVASGVSSSSSSVRQDISKAASATTYTWSLFAKKGEVNTLRLIPRDGATSANNVDARFNLTTGAVISVVAAGTFTNASGAIQSVGNGWYRCSLTFTSGTETSIRNQIFQLNNNATFTGNGTDGLFLWGAQLNLANMEGGVTSSLTTYYPTTTAAYYAPRFDYNPSTLQPRGLLIEEQRTNSIRNSTMQGAVAGTPGTLPTNWTASSIGGVALTQVVGVGTENGIAYIDVRYAGTTSSTSSGGITTDGTAQVAALSGQTWASSFYVRLVGGSTSGITDIFNTIQERDAGGALLAATNTTISPTGSALNTQRVATTRTLNNASTAFVNQQLRITPQSGVAIDITLRIGLPQLEQGAFATSVIPTTTTALTRNADVASMTGTNFSSWYNQSEGTFAAQASVIGATGATQPIIHANNGGNDTPRIMLIRRGDGNIGLNVFTTVTDADLNSGVLSPVNVATKSAGVYKVNDFAVTASGAAPVTDTVGAVPTVDRMGIGFRAGLNTYLNGHIQRLSFYPTRLPNATLVALTS